LCVAIANIRIVVARILFALRSSNNIHGLVGGFNPSEKYESQLGLFCPIYGKIKNVPKHQPVAV
jgi:hypothetical protein